MSGDLRPSASWEGIARTLGAHERRLQALESRYHPGDERIVFNRTGVVDTGVSDAHPVRDAVLVFRLTVTASTPASSSSTIALYVDAVSVATITLPSGDAYATVDLDPPVEVPAGSLVTTAATTVGTGLAGLVVVADTRP